MRLLKEAKRIKVHRGADMVGAFIDVAAVGSLSSDFALVPVAGRLGAPRR